MTGVLRYTRTDELEPVSITWYQPNGTLYNFTSGWTFRARIGTGSGFLVEKTTGFTGAATAPNLSINFTTGELDGIATGSYQLDVQATLTATAQTITRTWLFQVLAGVGTDTLPQSPISLSIIGDLTVGGDITLAGDLIGFPELASSDPAKVSVTTVGNITTLGVEKTVPEFARLTADSAPVNNSTTLVNVTGLAVPVAANAFYAIDGYIVYNCTNTSPDLKLAWTTPASVTGNWTTLGAGTGIAGSTEETTPNVGARGWGLNFLIGGNDFNLGACLRGNLATAGTAGTLQLQFAQATAIAVNTLIRAGSWIRAERLA